MLIVTKILVFILVFAILIVIKDGLLFASMFFGRKESVNLSTKEQIILACAISYIFMIITTGFKVWG